MHTYKEIITDIQPSDKNTMELAKKRLDSLIKPLGSLGKLEDIAAQLSAITGKINNEIKKKAVIVMSADNGVFEEKVACSPQYLTALQTINMIKGLTGISVLAKHANTDLKVIDIGINGDLEIDGLISKKIRKGTSNMAKGPAMTYDEAIKAIEIGIEAVREAHEEGYDLIGTGEMGIGNTSTSSAIIMSYFKCSADEVVGKGAGLSEEDYANKKAVISNAVKLNNPDTKDPIDVLAKVGGFDIAGLVGCYLGAAYYKKPIVIDGVISSVAAFIAYQINPLTKEYMIPSHCSVEPAYSIVMENLGLDPLLQMNMRLGEGTGCPLAFGIIESACAMMNNMATFDEIATSDDFLIDIR